MFVFISSRLGCLGSTGVSLVLTLVLLTVPGVLQGARELVNDTKIRSLS